MSYIDSTNIGSNSRLCNTSNTQEDQSEHHAPYKLMFLFFILFIGCLLRTMFASLRIPYTGVIIIIGLTGGILFNIFTEDLTFHTLTTSSPDLLVAIFLPVLVFESAYRTEYHAFMKSLYPILIFSMVEYSISLFSLSLLNKYLFFFQHWSFLQCFILGIILSTTRSVTLIRPADYSKTKRLNLILESETMINNCLAVILFNSMKTFVVHSQTWHAIHFFKTTTISLLGGIGLGFAASILEIIGLPYFYDDPISEITITIAVPYILYWLCEQVHCSGVVAIVILGILLSNHKTAISSEAATFMEKFWDILTLIVNTIIYLFASLAIAELIKPNVRTSLSRHDILVEIGLAVINYFICYIIRFLAIILFILCTKLCRKHHLSWKECLLITCGAFKGSLCLILALALAGEYQLADNLFIHPHSSNFQYQILIHTTLVVFLSSSINSIYSILLKILNLTSMSQTKYLYMAQCVDSLRALTQEQIRLLKKNKYLSNADWIFIEKNFQISNPHIANISSKEMNLINQTIPCSNCQRLIANEYNSTDYDDLVEEVRIHIINIQKTSFWKQYRDYEISTQTVRILSSLCDFAIDHQGQYISIDLLKYYYRARTFDFIWKYLGSLVLKLYHCVRDDWQKYHKTPKNPWRRFYFHILHHQRYHLFITFVVLLNMTLSILRSSIDMSYKVHVILTVIQSICILLYAVEFLIKIYAYEIRIYFRRWIYHRIEFILLIFAMIECGLEYYYLINWKSSRRIFSLLQIFILIQIFRLTRIVESITMNLNRLLDRVANRYVTLSLELCQAYISSEDDVLSKLYRIIQIDHIRDQFRTDSIKRRNEMIEELTFIQSEYPNVSASVKTRAAIQKLLNHSKNRIHHMTSKGLLGENEAHQIAEDINKRLHTELVPSVLFFPIPLHLLHIFPWLHDPDVLEYVLSRLHVQSFSLNEYIYQVDDDAQALFFITSGYVETIKNTTKYHDALAMEKCSKEEILSEKDDRIDQSQSSEHLCHQCRMERTNFSYENLFEWSDEDSKENHFHLEKKKKDLLGFNDSLHSSHFNSKDSSIFYRLLHTPGDIVGQMDLLNGQNCTETCKCITNTLVWYLKADDLIDLMKQFNHLRILDKIWHYTALQVAEIVLYDYINTLPMNATEQERIHIYGNLKHAFLIPESYLIEHKIIYSSHELILIQGQLQNTVSSLIYLAPCFIQIQFGQCGLKPLNTTETKILVLRSSHHTHEDEFIPPNDLPDILTHLIYDDKLAIYLPREYKHVKTDEN